MTRLCECGCGQLAPLASKTLTARGWKKGEPIRFIAGHHRKGRRRRLRVEQWKNGYRKLISDGKKRLSHRLRAEAALGHPLPPGAVVHHADGSKRDDAPLVICENAGYHNFLHVRMRIRAAGGNVNQDHWCSGCKRPLPREQFSRNKAVYRGYSTHCRACDAARKKVA